MTRIFIDADACPVKDEVLAVAARHDLAVTIVSNGGMRPARDPLVTMITVPKTPDAADDWIAERAVAGDIVVTADILLAKRCLDAGAHGIGPTGEPFTAANIGMAVAMRDLKQQLREAGEIRGHNPAFTAKNRSRFKQGLELLIRRAA